MPENYMSRKGTPWDTIGWKSGAGGGCCGCMMWVVIIIVILAIVV